MKRELRKLGRGFTGACVMVGIAFAVVMGPVGLVVYLLRRLREEGIQRRQPPAEKRKAPKGVRGVHRGLDRGGAVGALRQKAWLGRGLLLFCVAQGLGRQNDPRPAIVHGGGDLLRFPGPTRLLRWLVCG